MADVQQGFALVEYAELMVAEDSRDKLSEWFPLAEPADAAAAAALEVAASQLPQEWEAHARPGFVLRPQPPEEVSEGFVGTCAEGMSACSTSLRQQSFDLASQSPR